jgi:hypothetical protein
MSSPSSRSCSSRFAVLAPIVLLAGAWPHPAVAQHVMLESPAHVNASFATLLVSSPPFTPAIPPRVGTIPPLGEHGVEPRPARRPAALPALYASFALLQALDAHSTLTAVGAGRTEANPAVRGLVGQPATFIGVKLAATAGTLLVTERLWKRHRMAAVALMVAVNATYGAIVANNYRGAARGR